jgi:hypothetical protein
MKEKITQMIREIEKKVSDMKENPVVLEHLCCIKSMLKKSFSQNNPIHINITKVYESLRYIEAITIKTNYLFWGTSTISMAMFISNKGETIFPQPVPESIPLRKRDGADAVSAAAAASHFHPLHRNLAQLIEDRHRYLQGEKKHTSLTPPVVWSYEYPISNEFNEVISHPINKWRAEYVDPNSNPRQAYRDFKRSCSIRGMKAYSSEEIEDLLDSLLHDIIDFSEKKILREWLQANGGQDINRFLDYLLLEEEFTREQTALGSIKSIEQDWSIKNGKVVFFYEVLIYSFVCQGAVGINNGFGKIIPADITKSDSKTLPLMKIKAEIELRLCNPNVVVPSIIALNATSYSSDLINPKIKIEPETITASWVIL